MTTTTTDENYWWRAPGGNGWIDAWNGWYETEAEAIADGAAGVGRPWVLAYGEGLVNEDEMNRRMRVDGKFPYTAEQVENALSYVAQHGHGVHTSFDEMITAAAHQWYAEQQQRKSFANEPDEVEDLREFY